MPAGKNCLRRSRNWKKGCLRLRKMRIRSQMQNKIWKKAEQKQHRILRMGKIRLQMVRKRSMISRRQNGIFMTEVHCRSTMVMGRMQIG